MSKVFTLKVRKNLFLKFKRKLCKFKFQVSALAITTRAATFNSSQTAELRSHIAHKPSTQSDKRAATSLPLAFGLNLYALALQPSRHCRAPHGNCFPQAVAIRILRSAIWVTHLNRIYAAHTFCELILVRRGHELSLLHRKLL